MSDSGKNITSYSFRRESTTAGFQGIVNYIEVLKPRESILITYIGIFTALVAAGGVPAVNSLVLIFFSVLLSCAGANGLTNYLDRSIDARMERTRHRALPSGRIRPAEKVLPLTIGLVVIGLVLAWQLNLFCLIADLTGITAAIVWRKRWTCVFPQGTLASCTPVLMGWFGISPVCTWQLVLLCVLITVWLPIHLWSVMLTHHDDYLNAGLTYFPLKRNRSAVIKLLLVLTFLLYAASISIYFAGGYGLLYLVPANLLGVVLVYAGLRLVRSHSSLESWRLYKVSAFPYLGFIFLAMYLDILLM